MIGVTGASGRLATTVVVQLLKAVASKDIVAVTRTPEKVAGPRPDIAEAHFPTERALYQSGLQWTILRMGIFSETLFFGPLQRAIESGSYAAPASAPVAYLSRDDLAAAAATILAKPGHE